MARNSEFLNGAWKMENGSSTDYFIGTGTNDVGTQSGGTLSVTHPRTYYRDANEYDYEDRAHNDTPGTAWANYNDIKDGEQIPLFHVNHTPPILNYMMSTKDATPHAMGLAAHAAEEARLRFGERPWAASSLSDHSGPMVNTAITHGIIKGIEGKEAGELFDVSDSNGIDWATAHDSVQSAAKTHRRRLNEDGNVKSYYEDDTFTVDPKMISVNKGTIAKEGLHNKRAKALGKDPSSITPEEINHLKGKQWNNVQPELPF